MKPGAERQQDRVVALLSERGMARLSELTQTGITAAAVARMERKGQVIRLARGLYQLPDATLDANHSLAEAAKLVPNGIICLQSALAYHDLTDRIPRAIWMAIGVRDWRPRVTEPRIQIVRFGPKVRKPDGEPRIVEIEGVPVPIYGPAKTVVDEFRVQHSAGGLYRESLGYNLNTAIEGLRNALRQRAATPAEIARFAIEAGPKTWNLIRPYLEALTADA
jgi:predicted transcriptional regulator of viral defense system